MESFPLLAGGEGILADSTHRGAQSAHPHPAGERAVGEREAVLSGEHLLDPHDVAAAAGEGGPDLGEGVGVTRGLGCRWRWGVRVA